MSDTEKNNFHNFALQSFLFKGRPDLYFCYLKSEKLAHALIRIAGESGAPREGVLESVLKASALMPGTVVRFAAGEFEETSVLADLFETLSLVRLCVSEGVISPENGSILAAEYENIAEKISLGKNASPFLSLEDLSVPPLAAKSSAPAALPSSARGGSALQVPRAQKDISLGQHKGHVEKDTDVAMSERVSAILKCIVDNKRVSIKDIARVVRGCSEKTIQRDLNALIQQGLVRKEGERRWSVYLPNTPQ